MDAIRKFANKLVSQEGYKFGEALKKAWKDATIKERHFISPLSLYGKRSAEAPPAPPTGAERPGKGGKKGGKKGAKSRKGQPTTYQSASATMLKEAARRALSAISLTCARYASGHTPRHQCATATAKAADTQGAKA